MSKRKRLSKEERRKQIIEHASNLVAQKGFRSTSIRSIAKAADINEALIYQHFSSKDDLLIEIYKDFLNRSPKMHHVPETEEEFILMLSQIEEQFLEQNLKEPNNLKTLIYAALDGYDMPSEFSPDKKGSFLNWLNECLDKGKKEWRYDKNINNEIFISIFMGSIQYYIIQSSVTGVFDLENINFEGSFTQMFIKALKTN
jgi:AcrR family transcriptional regulator